MMCIEKHSEAACDELLSLAGGVNVEQEYDKEKLNGQLVRLYERVLPQRSQ